MSSYTRKASLSGPDLGEGPWGPGPQASHQLNPALKLIREHYTTKHNETVQQLTAPTPSGCQLRLASVWIEAVVAAAVAGITRRLALTTARYTPHTLCSHCDRPSRVRIVVAMVVASLPVTSCRRTALSLAALVMVAQLTTSPVLAMSANGLESRQRLQQLMHNGDGELATSSSDANIVSFN